MKNNLKFFIILPILFLLIGCDNSTEKYSPENNPNIEKMPAYQPDGNVSDYYEYPKAKAASYSTSKVEKEKNVSPNNNSSQQESLRTIQKKLIMLEENGVVDKKELAKACAEYGDALYQNNHFDEAHKAYLDAEAYGYEPMQELYFKMAKSLGMEGELLGSMEDYLALAFNEGFRDHEALLYDDAFANWREEYDFIHFYYYLFGEDKEATFDAFLSFAPERDLTEDVVVNPMVLFENTSYSHRLESGFYDFNPWIYGYFEDFVPGVKNSLYNPANSDAYRYVFKFSPNKNYTAVLYTKEGQFQDYLLPKQYILATYNKKGEKIAELEIASRGKPYNKCRGFVLHPDKSLEIIDYQISWKYGAKRKAYLRGDHLSRKDLKNTKPIDSQSYVITEFGDIIGEDIAMN